MITALIIYLVAVVLSNAYFYFCFWRMGVLDHYLLGMLGGFTTTWQMIVRMTKITLLMPFTAAWMFFMMLPYMFQKTHDDEELLAELVKRREELRKSNDTVDAPSIPKEPS